MKNFKFPQVLFLVMLFIIGCSSNDDDSTQIADRGEIVATIDGDTFAASGNSVGASLQSGVLNITASNTGADTISISINNFIGEGTFDLSGFTVEGTGIYLPAGDNRFFNTENEGGEGSITITSYTESSGLISGTFEFVAVRSNSSGANEIVTITSGSFNDISVTNS
ncbi:DUF6252 family protein [Dokdonia sp. Hel_I_53]|uniref:DUF6252 family protein n=1 Tax=Dokdonia sp. Hel_I_53 TaxID=1566287 RepID=UPI001199C3C1|nr:DUF6252 family protein [Dokdonia sp. Hel_I_53]TVZ51963.1 hypothetical protein OD90_1125 [Dokdonia sp. Hel_I_53]